MLLSIIVGHFSKTISQFDVLCFTENDLPSAGSCVLVDTTCFHQRHDVLTPITGIKSNAS